MTTEGDGRCAAVRDGEHFWRCSLCGETRDGPDVRAAAESSIREPYEALVKAAQEYFDAEDAFVHRTPYEYPEAPHDGHEHPDWVNGKLAWMAIGDRYDRARRKVDAHLRALTRIEESLGGTA